MSSLLVIALVISCISQSSASQNTEATSEVINTVCAKSLNPTSCHKILESTPGAATADLKGLGEITIKLASTNAGKALQQLQSLVAKTTDPKLKGIYSSCADHYGDAVDSLNDCDKDLKGGDAPSLNIHASASLTDVGDCEDDGQNSDIDPSIKAANANVEDDIHIILAISNLL